MHWSFEIAAKKTNFVNLPYKVITAGSRPRRFAYLWPPKIFFMRFVLVMLLCGVLSYLAVLVMPWWIPMLIAFAAVLALPMSAWRAFLAAGSGTGISYLLIALKADVDNAHLLSRKMAELFSLPHYGFMLLLTMLCGWITAGIGAVIAVSLNRLLRSVQSKEVEPG